MNDNQSKQVLDFLKKYKEINKTNVLLLDKEIREKKMYELRAYTEGKLSHLSFGHSIKGWIDQNGVIIANSKLVKKKLVQTEVDMKSTWTEDQQKYLNDMETRINQKIDDNIASVNKKIDDNHKEIKNDINLLTTAIKELTVTLTKHINEHK